MQDSDIIVSSRPDLKKCTKCQGMTLPDAPRDRPKIGGSERKRSKCRIGVGACWSHLGVCQNVVRPSWIDEN